MEWFSISLSPCLSLSWPNVAYLFTLQATHLAPAGPVPARRWSWAPSQYFFFSTLTSWRWWLEKITSLFRRYVVKLLGLKDSDKLINDDKEDFHLMYLTSPLLDDSRLHSLHHRQTAKASTLTAEMTSYVWDAQMDGKRSRCLCVWNLDSVFNTYVLLSDTPSYSGGIVT